MQLYYKHWSLVPEHVWRWSHFTPIELCSGQNKPGKPTPNGDLLISVDALNSLEILRSSLGAPIVLNSAYRNPIYNKLVGGAERSKHTMGIAFDIQHSPNYSVERLVGMAKEVGFSGFGYYKSFTHIDMGGKREWRS